MLHSRYVDNDMEIDEVLKISAVDWAYNTIRELNDHEELNWQRSKNAFAYNEDTNHQKCSTRNRSDNAVERIVFLFVDSAFYGLLE